MQYVALPSASLDFRAATLIQKPLGQPRRRLYRPLCYRAVCQPIMDRSVSSMQAGIGAMAFLGHLSWRQGRCTVCPAAAAFTSGLDWLVQSPGSKGISARIDPPWIQACTPLDSESASGICAQ